MNSFPWTYCEWQECSPFETSIVRTLNLIIQLAENLWFWQRYLQCSSCRQSSTWCNCLFLAPDHRGGVEGAGTLRIPFAELWTQLDDTCDVTCRFWRGSSSLGKNNPSVLRLVWTSEGHQADSRNENKIMQRRKGEQASIYQLVGDTSYYNMSMSA